MVVVSIQMCAMVLFKKTQRYLVEGELNMQYIKYDLLQMCAM